MKQRRRFISILLMTVLACGSITATAFAETTSTTIEEAQQKKEQLQSDLEEAQSLVEELQTSKDDLETAVADLDAQMTELSGQIAELETQSEEKAQEMADMEALLEDARVSEAEQYDSMKLRISYMYRNSGMSYLEALIEADSFAGFLKEARYINSIMAYDRSLLQDYKDTQEQIILAEETISQDQSDIAAMQLEVESKQQAVDVLMDEKQLQLADVSDELGDAEEAMEDYEQQIAEEDNFIYLIQQAEAEAKAAAEAEAQAKAEAEAQAQAAAEQQSSASTETTQTETTNTSTTNTSTTTTTTTPTVNTSVSYTGGVFNWPCPSSTWISSGYGARSSPTAGASSYHRGYDIAANYGASIVAASSGIVTGAGYSYASGNYVILSHGGGLYTCYYHCSSLAVSEGQSVSAGSTIAYVGSTGISTGPHLHFAVILNGNYVDPGAYL